MNNQPMVQLKNGAEVSWEEFTSWSESRQTANLVPWSFESKKARQETLVKNNSARSDRVNTSFVSSTARGVKTPKGICKSVAEAGLLNGVTANTIINWIKRGKEGFSYTSPPLLRRPSINVKKPPKNASTRRIPAKAVLTPDGRFPNVLAAANHYGVCKNIIYRRIKKDSYPDFRYDTTDQKIARAVITPMGTFANPGEAAKAYQMSAQAMRKRINSSNWVYFKYADL